MSIVDVLRVYRPNPGHERTIKYRRICSTREALPRTNREHGTARFLGREGLAKLLLEERDHFPGLYHSGDCENFGDEISERYPGSLSGILRLTRKCASFLSITSGSSCKLTPYEWPRLSQKDPPDWAMANVFSLRPTSVLILFVLPTASCVD